MGFALSRLSFTCDEKAYEGRPLNRVLGQQPLIHQTINQYTNAKRYSGMAVSSLWKRKDPLFGRIHVANNASLPEEAPGNLAPK